MPTPRASVVSLATMALTYTSPAPMFVLLEANLFGENDAKEASHA